MNNNAASRGDARRAIDPFPVRLAKRSVLLLLGPAYFVVIAVAPLACAGRAGFTGWYWRGVKRACERLLWLLSIRADMSEAHKAVLGGDTDSLIVVNHRSHLDGFALMTVVPDRKWFTFAAKKELFDVPLLRTGFRGAGLIEIDRKNGKLSMETLGDAVRHMPARRSVVLFAEGRRTSSESLGAFKAGAVVVARQSGRSIRPVVIHDSDLLLPKGRSVPRSGTIRVEVLAPFACDPDASVESDVARLRDVMVAAFEAHKATRRSV